MLKLTAEDLDRLAALVHLQADTLTEEGNLEGASSAAQLAEKIDDARTAQRRSGIGLPLLLV